MRLLNIVVAALLVLAAGYVYKSKFAATVEAERVAKLRIEVARERDRIAFLRAESAKLEAPTRIEGLAQRHLPLKPLDLEQIDVIDSIPFRPIEVTPRPSDEPAMAKADAPSADLATASISPPPPHPSRSQPAPPPIAARPASPPVTRPPVMPQVASRSPSPAITHRPPSSSLTSRSVTPLIVRRPQSAPVANRPAPRRYAAPAAPRDPFVAPLRPPADIWTNEAEPEEAR